MFVEYSLNGIHLDGGGEQLFLGSERKNMVAVNCVVVPIMFSGNTTVSLYKNLKIS